mgnify:CR=1 FL=1
MKQMVCALGILLVASAHATDVYMASGGNDSNGGTSWSDAVATLAGATAKITATGTHNIYIKQGTYTGAEATLGFTACTIQGGYEGTGTPGLFTSDPTNTILDGQNLNRILSITAGGAVNIRGLTFQNGKATVTAAGGGGAINHNAGNTGPLKVDRCRFLNNSVVTATTNLTIGGGAIRTGGHATGAEITNCVFSGNYVENTGTNGAVAEGGAIRWDNGNVAFTLVLRQCEFSNNYVKTTVNHASSVARGGAFIRTRGVVTLDRCSFLNNNAQCQGALALAKGGAVFITTADNVTAQITNVDNCYFYGNAVNAATADNGNGAAFQHEPVTATNNTAHRVTMRHCTFDKNDTDRQAIFFTRTGGQATYPGVHTLINCIVSNNNFGVVATGGVSATANTTLWYQNAAGNTGGTGTITDNTPVSAPVTPIYVSGNDSDSGGNPHLTTGAKAIGAGEAISGFQNDIDILVGSEVNRPTPLDVGCDQFNWVPVSLSGFAVE